MSLPNFENAPGPPPVETDYEAIEEMAHHGFTIPEICEVLELDIFWFTNETSKSYKAYRKGFLQSQLELRQRIFIDAKHGSSPAQTLAAKILDAAEFELKNR